MMSKRQDKRQEATAIAETALTVVDTGGYDDTYEYVGATTIVVGRGNHGYWVADNGEETNGLTRTQAKQIIIENLSA